MKAILILPSVHIVETDLTAQSAWKQSHESG